MTPPLPELTSDLPPEFPHAGFNRPGFTLIEMIVTLALMALLTGVATLSLGGRLQSVQQEDVLAAIKAVDRRARFEAMHRQDPVTLGIDPHTGLFAARSADNRGDQVFESYQLPSGIRVSGYWIVSGGKVIDQRELQLELTPEGHTYTYGFTLKNLSGEHKNEMAIIIAGTTGQLTVYDNEREAKNIMEKISGRHSR